MAAANLHALMVASSTAFVAAYVELREIMPEIARRGEELSIVTGEWLHHGGGPPQNHYVYREDLHADGVIAGTAAGDRFYFRNQLHIFGLHQRPTRIVDYRVDNGQPLAVSVVIHPYQGAYPIRQVDAHPEVVQYIGGIRDPNGVRPRRIGDRAMINSYANDEVVRVICVEGSLNVDDALIGVRAVRFTYVYRGIYNVHYHGIVNDRYHFTLNRINNQ